MATAKEVKKVYVGNDKAKLQLYSDFYNHNLILCVSKTTYVQSLFKGQMTII